VLPGENWNKLVAPLSQPGVNVRAGEFIPGGQRPM
jgi:tricorn protease